MRRWIKQWLPKPESLNNEKSLGWISKWLHTHTYLWQINHRSVARGVAAGLLVAFIPLPIQILLAAILAVLIRANLPTAVVATLVSNPITFLPITYLIYKVGTLVTQANGIDVAAKINALHINWNSFSEFWQSLLSWVYALGPSYFIGLAITSVAAAILGYFLTYLIWSISVRLKWLSRKKRNKH